MGAHLHPAAYAAGLPGDAVARGRALPAGLSEPLPGWYLTGDAGYKDDDGYLYIMSRIDDVINVAGHRLSTGGMEEVLASHKDVAECAVIGVADQLKGELPLGLVVLKAGVTAIPRPSARSWWHGCATGSDPWRPSSWWRSSPACRRPARARSYAAR